MKKLFDALDRIYLNTLNLKGKNKGSKFYKEIVELIKKDVKIVNEFEGYEKKTHNDFINEFIGGDRNV